MLLRLVFIFTFIFFVSSLNIRRSPEQHPVILVPGYLGSRAYIRPKSKPKAKPKSIWLNLKRFLKVKELIRKFSLQYDTQTHKVIESQKYEIEFPGWGETKSIEYIDPKQKKYGKYFTSITKALRKNAYFKSPEALRGAPYDFRRAPKHNPEFLTKMKKLIEDTFYGNNGRKVVIVGHSMGTLYTHWFLSKQSDSWKRKFIHAFISIGGPYGGAVKAIRTMASGENAGVSFVNPLDLRKMFRTMTSLAFILPQAKFWPTKKPIVITPRRNYTAHEMKQLFIDMNYPEGYDMMKATQMDFTRRPTGIKDIYCAYGINTETPEQIVYRPPNNKRGAFPDQTPKTIFGDGDGTVNRQSLEVCSKWDDVLTLRVPGAKHRNVMEAPELLDLIKRVAGL